jgi:hypothetical protein
VSVAAAAARAGARQVVLIIGGFLHGIFDDRRNLQEFAEASDVVAVVAMTISLMQQCWSGICGSTVVHVKATAFT